MKKRHPLISFHVWHKRLQCTSRFSHWTAICCSATEKNTARTSYHLCTACTQKHTPAHTHKTHKHTHKTYTHTNMHTKTHSRTLQQPLHGTVSCQSSLETSLLERNSWRIWSPLLFVTLNIKHTKNIHTRQDIHKAHANWQNAQISAALPISWICTPILSNTVNLHPITAQRLLCWCKRNSWRISLQDINTQTQRHKK